VEPNRYSAPDCSKSARLRRCSSRRPRRSRCRRRLVPAADRIRAVVQHQHGGVKVRRQCPPNPVHRVGPWCRPPAVRAQRPQPAGPSSSMPAPPPAFTVVKPGQVPPGELSGCAVARVAAVQPPAAPLIVLVNIAGAAPRRRGPVRDRPCPCRGRSALAARLVATTWPRRHWLSVTAPAAVSITKSGARHHPR